MYDDSLSIASAQKKFTKGASKEKEHVKFNLRFEGHNEDLTESYFWIYNFAYYTGKGYTTIKLEDYHHFSENSQFGMQQRQIKGGSIQAFQNNMDRLIQLVKVHLMPLLKEVKQADFYNQWMKEITDSDKIVQEEIKKKGDFSKNEKYLKAKAARDEAISHMKDKWVNEVEGGRMWQMSRQASEQGLDFSLLPQLFFGTNLENPLHGLHNQGKSLKDQLDSDIYTIDVSKTAKEQVARQIYKFHIWLPTAIRDTQISYKIKLASLRQIYTQIQMYINVIKPLLMEIARKNEGVEQGNFYRGFEMENPEFVNLFDTSYMYIRNIGIRNFGKNERGKWNIADLEFNKYGLYLREKDDIISGAKKEKTGYIIGEKEKKYSFIETNISPNDMNDDKYEELKKKSVEINKDDLKKFPIMQIEFIQKRRNEMIQTPQGPQFSPFIKNQIIFTGYAWNIFEIAIHREELKEKNLELLESFIGEIKEVKEDLLKYVSDFDSRGKTQPSQSDSKKEDKKEDSTPRDLTLLIGPFQGIYELISPLIPSFSIKKQTGKQENESKESALNKNHLIMQLSIMEDTWKVYTIYKKAHAHKY